MSREGSVAVEFLADPVSRDEKLDEAHEFVPASLLLMPLPEYPSVALAGGGPSALVGVRLSINAAGVVVVDGKGVVSVGAEKPVAAPSTAPERVK